MPNLSGKTALVTGASRGIGRASALAAAGAQVLVHYGRGADEADGVVAEIRTTGGRSETIGADLATAEGPHKLAKLTRDVVGDRLDILVANAGISKSATVEENHGRGFRQAVCRQCSRPLLPGAAASSDPVEWQQHRFLLFARSSFCRRDDSSLCSNQGRHRYSGETFRLASGRPWYPGQRDRAWCRRD